MPYFLKYDFNFLISILLLHTHNFFLAELAAKSSRQGVYLNPYTNKKCFQNYFICRIFHAFVNNKTQPSYVKRKGKLCNIFILLSKLTTHSL